MGPSAQHQALPHCCDIKGALQSSGDEEDAEAAGGMRGKGMRGAREEEKGMKSEPGLIFPAVLKCDRDPTWDSVSSSGAPSTRKTRTCWNESRQGH